MVDTRPSTYAFIFLFLLLFTPRYRRDIRGRRVYVTSPFPDITCRNLVKAYQLTSSNRYSNPCTHTHKPIMSLFEFVIETRNTSLSASERLKYVWHSKSVIWITKINNLLCFEQSVRVCSFLLLNTRQMNKRSRSSAQWQSLSSRPTLNFSCSHERYFLLP